MSKRILSTLLLMATLALVQLPSAWGARIGDKYTADRPLVIAGDWDKPPYEFLNDKGQPAGINIDLMQRLCSELDIPCRFILKEWSGAIKTFERNEADLILANARRYRSEPYCYTENIINYNRIFAAARTDSAHVVSYKTLLDEGIVLKPGDYTAFYFRDLDSTQIGKVEFQSPKVALQGLLAGDFQYFLWGEEPLKWKIKELNLEGIQLCSVDIPVSEIHIVGRDRDLIYELDDTYSRLKQSGEVQRINDRWLHPERADEDSSTPLAIFIVVGTLLLAGLIYSFSLIARAHVRNATRNSSDLNNMMYKALHMGNFHVMEYDIRHDRMTNRYGAPLLPEEGITLEEFTSHIHPQEADEFRRKMSALLNGRERKFELRKRWHAYGENDQWLNLEGHAIVELDAEGHPAFVINAVNDVTENVAEDRAALDLVSKYNRLANMPLVAMSFYDADGWIIDLNDDMRQLCGITPDNPEAERYWTSISMFDIPMFRSAYQHGAQHALLACMHMDYPEMGIDRYIEYDVRPIFNQQGQVANYFCSTLDISERHDADHQLHAIELETQKIEERTARYDRWLQFLTKKGNTYLWRSDVGQQTAYFYRTLDEKRDDDNFIVMPFKVHCDHMRPEDGQQAMEYFLRPEAFNSIQRFNSTVVGGGESWFIISGTPVYDDQGRFTGHRGLSIDITREMSIKLELERELSVAKDIGRLKSGFMASMTHELRTPLNAIIGFSGVLPAIDTPAERQEYIRIIRNNCDMLQRLISDILTASSLNDGPTSIKPVIVDFAKAFDDICMMLRQRIETDAVDYRSDNPYVQFITTLDVDRVQQVLTNFVTNAIKFTHQGSISLGYRYQEAPNPPQGDTPSPHGLYCYCQDTGIGIPKDKQGIVFDRFVKLDEFVQGTGMGLHICKQIAERCGGQIGVSSQGADRGSIFWLWIPITKPQAVPKNP